MKADGVFPAGKSNLVKTIDTAVIRELAEETGVKATTAGVITAPTQRAAGVATCSRSHATNIVAAGRSATPLLCTK
ncbi:NUDIX domain-containing protein [Rhizobium tumorigenes]|uniref:NUDIX domain-containing protein n=1 Tax=Rhizobium tumorigenes TaxID=2041385 RepID=UPI0031011211